jgi:acyl-CoA synthetase (AMP-forming)/AMP-acid ligase II
MAIVRSPFSDVDIPDVALTDQVMALGADDDVALIEGTTGRSWTYAELRGAIAAFAGGLAASGFGPGDVLAILSPNTPEYAVLFHGALRAGGTVTTVNPLYGAEELTYQLQDSGAKRLVTPEMFIETARAAAASAGIDEIIVLGDPIEGTTPLADLMNATPMHDQVPVDYANHVAVMPYSSGTTGLPKGVMLTHRNLVANLEQSRPMLDMEPREVVMAVLPFFHIYGMHIIMNGTLAVGATAVTTPRFDLEQFLGLIQEHGITRAYLVPPIVLALAKHPIVDQYDLSSLEVITSGAAPLGEELASELKARIDCDILQGYGLTETSPLTHASPRENLKLGSIGRLAPNTECRIVDTESGQDLDANEDGEVWMRGPQVMLGYLNKPEATASTIDADGWIHTGDIGHYDADGDFYIVDRLKELIKYKGFQVPPAELEALLLTNPKVADAAVIPVPDEEAGELPKAFVVLKPDQEATDSELMQFVAGHVASYKQIRLLEFTDAIPKSASGKILRRVLRDQEAAKG